MNMISRDSLVRGADGRLYAITAAGVSPVAEAGTAAARAALRAGDRIAFDAADHEAARNAVSPGL
ncbi:hypothetical protein [Azospirillum sp.]|uniref:hypothetical protein n=1 Tax=Azospirillum sp. TaxID=34012 RepID=UPI002D44E95F|nr:hypothetical protein [Azospirillum sp.]HYD67840.1 hypothetical protein [Azospirillum sp.]